MLRGVMNGSLTTSPHNKLTRLVTLWLAILAFALAPHVHAAGLRFAWLSDTHIGATTSEEDLRASVRAINALDGLSFVVVSGDVTEYGSREQLTLAHQILAELKVPSYAIPGNHDTKWSESGATDFARIWPADRFQFERDGIVFVGIHQGPLMRMGDGHWAPQDVRWLRETLKRVGKAKPLIFITHYPVDDSIANWFAVLDILKGYNTQAILCGHGHANRKLDFEGIPGVMGRSNLRARTPGHGFNVVEIDNPAKLISFVANVSGEMAKDPWHSLPFGPRDYSGGTNAPRPDYAVNQQYPDIRARWEHEAGFTIAAGPAIWRDLAIVGDAWGAVTALQSDSGKVRWKFTAKNAVYSTPAVNGDRVFVASTEGAVYGLDAASGRRLWRHALDRPVVAAPLAVGDRVYVGSSEGKFVALDARTGERVWTFDGVKGFVETRPLMHDGKLFFGAWGQQFYAVNAASGSLAWAWKGGTPGPLLSPAACEPVAANGKVFIAAPDRFLTAIDSTTGTNTWRTKEWVVRETLGLSADATRLYAREMNDFFLAMDTTTATPQPIWRTNAGFGYDINSAQIVEKDGIVYYGTKNGLVFALDGRTGEILWKHKIGNALVNTLAAIGSGRVVASDFDGRVVLLSKGSKAP